MLEASSVSITTWNARAACLSSWREIVRETLNDLDCRLPNGGSFVGAMSHRDLMDTRFVRIGADRHSVSNRGNSTVRAARDHLLLSVLEEGSITILQGGRRVTLQPGDMAIYDISKPYHFIVERPFVQTVLRIRRDDLSRRLPELHDFTARRIDGTKGLGRVTSAHIRELYGQLDSLPNAAHRLAHRSLLDIVAGALSGPDMEASRWLREHQHLMLQRIMSFVEDNLFNHALSCEGVAGAVGISQRYLRKLCSTSGYSLSERILERRLEEASQKLSASDRVRMPITSIAYDCGFKDAAHFSRAFKIKFGVTPRDYRNCAPSGMA